MVFLEKYLYDEIKLWFKFKKKNKEVLNEIGKHNIYCWGFYYLGLVIKGFKLCYFDVFIFWFN